ncbi:MAG: noncanonical pyrimidine nucleotidase, YjjG family [Bacteroidetes bacterium]|nr:noncanonical pyrimidine nucleotidase, YjjG family [Bacteroidota bacterium]
MSKYKHVFFDLDRTLWDFDSNSLETFQDLYNIYNIKNLLDCNFSNFHNVYKKHNNLLWDAYRKGEIKKDYLSVHRFLFTLNEFGCNDLKLAVNMSEDYIKLSPQKNLLFPHTHEVLTHLQKKYYLHIITNGFIEVQYKKIKNSGLDKYFTTAIISEEAGFQKPDKQIFYFSLEKTGAKAEESIMIGDDLKVDILGAKQVGIDQIFYNNSGIQHNEKITFEVDSLKKIINILN